MKSGEEAEKGYHNCTVPAEDPVIDIYPAAVPRQGRFLAAVGLKGKETSSYTFNAR